MHVNNIRVNTTLGIFAILFWSTNVAFSRSVVEQLGLLTAGAAMFLLGGLLSLIYTGWKEKGLHFLKRTSKKYLFGCGFLFIVNTVSFLVAVGASATRTQSVIAGLINNIWPVLGLWFSLFILKNKAKNFLFFGIALALGGMWLASTNGEVLNYQEALQPANLGVYAIALVAAISWGLYSNWSRKWANDQDSGVVPVFLLCTGILLALLRLFIPETVSLTSTTFLELAYMVVFPTMLAYIFWDAAMRKGNMVTAVSFSYFIPLFSIIISSLRLGVQLRPDIWVAALMIIGAAYICRQAIVEPTEQNQ